VVTSIDATQRKLIIGIGIATLMAVAHRDRPIIVAPSAESVIEYNPQCTFASTRSSDSVAYSLQPPIT